jgi:hypothetical protein
MPLGMLGRVKQQAEDGRRETAAPDFPRLEQARFGRRSQLLECASDGCRERSSQAGPIFLRRSNVRLRDQGSTL